MTVPSVLLVQAAPLVVRQEYLLQARQMQALSFAVHIPLVCFGVALSGVAAVRGVAAICAAAIRSTGRSRGAGRG